MREARTDFRQQQQREIQNYREKFLVCILVVHLDPGFFFKEAVKIVGT